MKLRTCLAIAVCTVGLAACSRSPQPPAAPAPAARVHVTAASDAKAIEIAQSVIERMGGWEAWDATRFVSWRFFGRRQHLWDRRNGLVRIEGKFRGANNSVDDLVIAMNVETKKGHVWNAGVEVADPAELARALDTGHRVWINDSYWMFMPYKLLDPGVTLKYGGERAMQDGRMSDVLVLTFDPTVGYTPENRYEVCVARDTGLVEQWSYFAKASDTEPGFTMPWHDWQRFGGILLARDHGEFQEGAKSDWDIAVLDTAPVGSGFE